MATVSLAVHAGLLVQWHHRPQDVSLGTDAAPSVLQVALLSSTQTPWPKPSGADALPAQTAPTAGVAASPVPQTEQAPPQSRQQAVNPENARLQQAATEWAYLPASQLDQRPRPKAQIQLPFPEGETLAPGTRVSAVLVLYVSEEGAVDRIEFGQSGLPAAFERVALESFARVRMRPGIKNGRARRAMMKIEVEFEAPVSKQAAAGVVLESSHRWQGSP